MSFSGCFRFALIIIITSILPTLAVPVPDIETAAPAEAAAHHDGAPSDADLTAVITGINATIQRATAAGPGSSLFEDPSVLDDLQRLLDIIATHAERMRGDGSNININNAPPRGVDFRKNPGQRKAQGGAASNGAPHPAKTAEDAAARGGEQQQQRQQQPPPPPQSELQVTSDEHGFINITCKGISVCNPVTVIHGKDGKKIRLDKLDKAAAKAKKKKKGSKD